MKNIIFLGLLFITSCTHKLTEGTIVSKKYEPARTWVQVVPITISTGKSTMVTMVPMVLYDNEDFILLVRGHTDDGDVVLEHFYVTESAYNSVNIGDYVGFAKETMSYSDKVEKSRQQS